MGKVENAVALMESIARNDNYGYDQGYRWGERGDFDCSSLIIYCYQQAGIPVKSNGATYTGDMRVAFIKTGFQEVIGSVNLNTGAGLLRGDVLLKTGHCAMYCGNNLECEAASNEWGGLEGGQPGDQTGQEIRIGAYINQGWTSVLRYPESTVSVASAPTTTSPAVDPNYPNYIGEVYNVAPTILNVRTGPGANYPIYDAWPALGEGNRVDVYEESNGFVRIRIAGIHYAWASKAYIRKIADYPKQESSQANADAIPQLQLSVKTKESYVMKDGMPDPTVTTLEATFYFVSAKSTLTSTGNVTSSSPKTQTVTCTLGSKSQTFSVSSADIANALNNYGDSFVIGTLTTQVPRKTSSSATVKYAVSCKLDWVSGAPQRNVSGQVQCWDTRITIKYDLNGGGGYFPDEQKIRGWMYQISSVEPVKPGSIFAGWSISKNGTASYRPGDEYWDDKNNTLYAIWMLDNVRATLTSTTIEIPCAARTASNGQEYLYCDPLYYIEIPYSISYTGTASEITAQPYYTGGESVSSSLEPSTQLLNANRGSVAVSMETIGKSIINAKSTTSVPIGIRFRVNIGGQYSATDAVVNCTLRNFKFFNPLVALQSIVNNGENVFVFKCDNPTSFNTIAEKHPNAHPLLAYKKTDGSLALLEFVECLPGGFYKYKISLASSVPLTGIDIYYLDSVLLYDPDWGAGSPPASAFHKHISTGVAITSSKNIVLTNTKKVQCKKIIEGDYVTGFFNGGAVVGKEFIESSSAMVITNNKFQCSEFIES